MEPLEKNLLIFTGTKYGPEMQEALHNSFGIIYSELMNLVSRVNDLQKKIESIER